MEVGLIFKIAAVGILVTILSRIVPYIFDLFSTIQTLFSL